VAELLDVVRDLAAVGDPASFPTVALNSVDGLVPADISTYNEVDPVTGTAWAARPDSFVASPAQVAVFDAHQEEHPLISYMQRTGDGSARRISDVLSNDTFRSNVLYREFYGPLGIEYQMAVALALLMTETTAARPDDRPVPFGITRRESEILHLAATGATNASIGATLHISPGTVKKHLDNIYRKLGVRSRVEAIAFIATTPQIGSGWS
jgi:DNA-binding NarL/FixJ family response regulator